MKLALPVISENLDIVAVCRIHGAPLSTPGAHYHTALEIDGHNQSPVGTEENWLSG